MITKPVVFDEEFDEVDPLIPAIVSAKWRIVTLSHVVAGHFTAAGRAMRDGRVDRNWRERVGDRLDDAYLGASNVLHDELRACCRELTGKHFSGRYRFGGYLVDIGTPVRNDESLDWPALFYTADLSIVRWRSS